MSLSNREEKLALGVFVVLALGVVLALRPSPAVGGTYSDHWWDMTSPSPDCACDNCGCEKPSEWVLPGVSVRTGEVMARIPLFTIPGKTTTHSFGLLYRGYIDGATCPVLPGARQF